MSFAVDCCKRRGLASDGILICPVCDFDAVSGAGPDAAGVRDIDEDVVEVIPVTMSVEGTTRVIGWVADLSSLPDLLEQVAAELRAVRAEQ